MVAKQVPEKTSAPPLLKLQTENKNEVTLGYFSLQARPPDPMRETWIAQAPSDPSLQESQSPQNAVKHKTI